MRFKEGNLVEVLKNENDPCGCWFPGIVTSVDGNNYNVRYKGVLNHKGEPAVERVHGEDVRPRPSNEKGERWMIGDIAEVFDVQCWRVAKILKVLKNVHFVVKLFGSIQLREFHKSNLRIRQAWHNNKWSVVGKFHEIKQTANKDYSEQPQSLMCRAPPQGIHQGIHLKVEDGKKHLKDRHNHNEMCLPVRTTKRSHTHCSEPLSSEDLLMVDDPSSPKVRVDEKSRNKTTEMDAHVTPLSIEGSDQCSIASCSLNTYADYPGENSESRVENILDNSDAESSSLPLFSKIIFIPSPRHNLEIDIHKLEVQAYNSTMLALYASGPLSWEQESLLTNLRLSLNISNDEHLLQLRHLLSTQVG
uniref:ENT domain-containing protein n=1 Tax=Fagus sylvatica TaxID=28930 RepID=A0A2N9FX14_FAGSY